LEEAQTVIYAHTELPVVSPVGLLVTKYLTFTERGKGDYYGSHDLEDFITVIDGRANIVEEIAKARSDFRSFLAEGVRELLKNADFRDTLPGFLPPDAASQQRLPKLRAKLEKVAELKTPPTSR